MAGNPTLGSFHGLSFFLAPGDLALTEEEESPL
jgi:hypothetical protein